jgi:hypothetical protein
VAAVPRRVPIVLIAFLLAALAACGPSNGGAVDSGDYANAVCGSLLSWRQGVTTDSTKLSADLQARSGDIATVKAKYTAFYRSIVARTDTLVAAVRKAGAPKVDNGSSYARDLLAALNQTRSGLATAQRRFAALPTTDLRSYAAGAGKIRDDLGKVFLGVGDSLDTLGRTYPDKGLNQAFERSSDCQNLA